MATDVGTLQSKLTLDFSQFASGMNSAISMVRSFGKQLQRALGNNATQGFSTTNQAINDIQTSITNLQGAVSTFQATMQNTNTTLAQFSNLQANTSRMGQNLQQASNSVRNVSRNAQNASSQLNGVSRNSRRAAQEAQRLRNHLSESQRFANDLKRILGGIVISQGFYKILGIMQDLVNSSVEFMHNMEQSAIAFKYLLGSADNASGFLTALQDFAVSSPLDMQGAETAARMLMTMGFEAESTISVLRVLTDTATVAGGELSDTVNRIALALGQMLQSGHVKMQEIRQLVNANIPIFEILQEELGLTSEQIANIGDAAVDSSTAVVAILNGLQKRFGGAGQEMQTTFKGALSAATDSFYILFNEVMAGPYESFRQKIVQLSNTLQHLAQVARQYGAGGVFEELIPERLHGILRNVIGAFMQLGKAISFLGKIVTEFFGGMGEIVANILNVILPPISILLNAIMQFVYGLLQAYPIIKYFFSALLLLAIARPIGAVFLWFWKVIGLGKIIMLVVGYIQSLVKAFIVLGAAIITHPIIAGIAAIVAAVLVLTGAFQKAINKIKEFFSLLGAKVTNSNKTINQNMGIGYDPNTILQPTNKETNDSADKYKASLEDIASKLEDVGDEANKTKNKLKNAFNQSFDEVYTINPNTGSDLGLDGLENLDLSLPLADLGAFNDALADLGNFDLSSWVDSFMISWKDMWEKIKQRLAEYGIPALLAALGVGLTTKNPWAALAAALATLFWPEICSALGLTQEEGNRLLGKTIGTLLGGAIGGIIGGPGGAVIGASIGFFVGDVMGLIMNGFQTGEWDYTAISTSIGTGVGIAIGAIVGGPGGALIGGAIGNLVGYIIGEIITGIETGEWDIQGLSIAIGTGLGAGIGFIVGGPAGALIGAAIGALVGWIVDKFIEADWGAVADAFKEGLFGEGGLFGWSTEMFSWAAECFEKAKEAFENEDWAGVGKWILEGILFGLTGAITFIFEPISRFFTALWEGFCEIFGIHSPAKEMEPIGENIFLGILEGILGMITGIPAYIAEAGVALIESMAAWFVDIGDNVSSWFGDGVTAIQTFIDDTGTKIKTWATDRIADFDNFKSQVSSTISNWSSSVKSTVSTWATDTSTKVSNWVTNRISDFDNFKEQTKEKLSSWASDAKDSMIDFAAETGATVSTWVLDRAYDFKDFTTKTKEAISNWVSNTKSNISTWANGTKTSISTWASNTKSNISTWVSDTSTNISNWWSDVKLKFESFTGISFTNWCSSTFQSISNWCSDVWSSIKEKIGNAIEKIKEFFGLSGTNANISVSATVSGSGNGHATGGVFNREHWARFAEGNKAEAIIPLENSTAMQPFVDAVSDGLVTTLAPMMATNNSNNTNNNNLQPLYVGTLIADERGLKELERKMQIIRIKEERR